MFKKISAFVLALAIALTVTYGLSAHVMSSVEESEVTMCDLPPVKVSI